MWMGKTITIKKSWCVHQHIFYSVHVVNVIQDLKDLFTLNLSLLPWPYLPQMAFGLTNKSPQLHSILYVISTGSSFFKSPFTHHIIKDVHCELCPLDSFSILPLTLTALLSWWNDWPISISLVWLLQLYLVSDEFPLVLWYSSFSRYLLPLLLTNASSALYFQMPQVSSSVGYLTYKFLLYTKLPAWPQFSWSVFLLC